MQCKIWKGSKWCSLFNFKFLRGLADFSLSVKNMLLTEEPTHNCQDEVCAVARACVSVCLHVYLHLYVYVCASVWYVRVCMDVPLCVRACVRARARVCVCVCVNMFCMESILSAHAGLLTSETPEVSFCWPDPRSFQVHTPRTACLQRLFSEHYATTNGQLCE